MRENRDEMRSPIFFIVAALFPALSAGCLPGPARETAVASVRLAEREKACREEARRHLLPEGLIVYRMDWPDTLALRYGRARRQADGAYFQGLFTAALAQRASMTKTEEARREALRAWRVLHRLMEISGYEGLVARSFGKKSPEDEAYDVRDDASGDQVTGFVWGTYWAWRCLGTGEVKQGAAKDLRSLVAHLKRHDMKIHRRPGDPTRFGQYDVDVLGLVPIGHRAVGALAVALLARVLNPGDEVCAGFLDELIRRDYHRKARYFYPWFPHSAANTVNYLLNLFLVWTLDESPHRRGFYAVGRESAWNLTHDWQMSLYASLYLAMGGESHARQIEDSLRRLRNLPDRFLWYENEEKAWRVNVVPIENRPSSTSYWSQSPRLELVGRDEAAPVRIARIDFLSAYWLGRYFGYYRAGE